MEICIWKIHDFDNQIYESDCGELHYFTESGPKENKYKFCPYCGKLLKEKKPKTIGEA
jgi:hypothetical protein